MRGKGAHHGNFLTNSRITPAYAGKSSGTEWGFRTDWDHPRLCGEKRMAGSQLLTDTGSPPPMRGKGKSPCSPTAVRRITPAYAGKSTNVEDMYRIEWDHPRLCGEKRNIFRRRSCGTGSPPPMRGKDNQAAGLV